jgi:hypothetical protein
LQSAAGGPKAHVGVDGGDGPAGKPRSSVDGSLDQQVGSGAERGTPAQPQLLRAHWAAVAAATATAVGVAVRVGETAE